MKDWSLIDKKVIGLLLVVFTFGCVSDADKDKKKQNFAISKDTMQYVMRDICLVEGRLKRKYALNGLTSDSTAELLYGEIFAKYNTNQDEFKSTYEAYANSPDELSEIMRWVEVNLKQAIDTIPEVEKKK